jgi:hypothetical protein
MMDKMDTMDKNGMEWTIDMDDACPPFCAFCGCRASSFIFMDIIDGMDTMDFPFDGRMDRFKDITCCTCPFCP